MTDKVHLWLARPAGRELDMWRRTLNAPELARAGRYRFAEDRDAFIAAHGLRRQAIGQSLGLEPASVRFDRTAKGRPTLASAHDRPFAFSASRRRNLVAVCVAPLTYLGIDVENVTPVADHHQLLEKFLDADSMHLLDGLAGTALDKQFARLWTITEACAKARGTGLETFVPRLSIRMQSADTALVLDGQVRWRCDLSAPDDLHSLAVAYDAPDWLPVIRHLQSGSE